MTVVFVHGVPETPGIWDNVRRRLPQESVALRLPGFGSPGPDEIVPSRDEIAPSPGGLKDKDAYADWLARELRAVGGPVDLVGHDWGGHLAMRVVSAYDVPVRSWVSDVAYGWHPRYEWHFAARLWQKSPEGEQSLAGLRAGVPGTFGQLLQPRGMTAEYGAEVDAAHDEAMSAAILALYRSADPNFEPGWGAAVTSPVSTPGLVLVPTGDAMDGVDQDLVLRQNEEVARTFGAEVVRLDGLGHYWMLQDPGRAAATLQEFWSGLKS